MMAINSQFIRPLSRIKWGETIHSIHTQTYILLMKHGKAIYRKKERNDFAFICFILIGGRVKLYQKLAMSEERFDYGIRNI